MLRSAIAIAGLLACIPVWAAPGDPAAGKRKTVTCNACHGQAGMKNLPSLGGQSSSYFIAAMWAYKDNVRSHATMRDVAGSLSVRDFANLAAYYADAPAPTPSEEPPAPSSSARCAVCHGADGWEVVTPDAARLAGQKALYLEQVLRDYRAGTRKHPVMQEQAATLSDEEISELAAYYASRNGLFVK